MVDVIKFLPSISTSFPSDIHRLGNRSSCEQISFPIFFSTTKTPSQNDRSIIINNTKRWIGRCPGDPPRHFNISDLPDGLHRKFIDRELSRYFSTTVDTSALIKIKPQQKNNNNKESSKLTTVPSNSILPDVDASNSSLSNALLKHVTIKAEPLRPVNNFLNNTLSSWQTYWTSTYTQKPRKETNESESILYRPKRHRSLLPTTQFVTVRDSSFQTPSENNTNSRTSSTTSNNCTLTKVLSPIIFEKPSLLIKEENQVFLPIEKPPPMNLEDKSLSPIQSESAIINDEGENDMNIITRKMYKLPLPSDKQKTNKSILKKGTRSKSLEKKPIIPSTLLERKDTSTTSLTNISVSKRKQQTTSNKSHRSITKKQQQSLSTVMVTTPRSKYEQTKWDEPYIGVRYDPPAPPCSPLLTIWPQNENIYL